MKLQAILLIGLLSFAVGCGDSDVVQKLDLDGAKTDESLKVDETPIQISTSQVSGGEFESASDSSTMATEIDARALLSQCLASAKAEDKKVLVHFGSPG